MVIHTQTEVVVPHGESALEAITIRRSDTGGTERRSTRAEREVLSRRSCCPSPLTTIVPHEAAASPWSCRVAPAAPRVSRGRRSCAS